MGDHDTGKSDGVGMAGTIMTGLFAVALVGPAAATRSMSAGHASGNGLPTTTFDTRTDARFADPAVPLRAYLRRPYNRRHRGPQHFCIIGYVGDDGARFAEVHWREGRMLIRWPGATGPEWLKDSILLSPGKLDLTRDVVASEAEIAGSTYRVTRGWVAQVLRDCAGKGVRYIVRP